MKRKLPAWLAEFELLQAQEVMDDFDAMIHEEALRVEKAERYRLKRERNMLKALRIRPRLYRVQSFDIWANAEQQGEDDWGDLTPRNNEVKALYARKAKLVWILTTLFNYWSFDYRPTDFRPNKKTLTFSYLSKRYDEYLEQLKEQVRQDNWDRKRARVKAAREKREQRKAKSPFDHRVKSRISEMLTLRFGASGPTILVKTGVPDISEKALAQKYDTTHGSRESKSLGLS